MMQMGLIARWHETNVVTGGRQELMTRVVILAGGQGTRLRPYTAVLPKPLLPIGDRPVLDIVLHQLRAAGFERVTVATGYMAELIEAVLDHRNTFGMEIDYVREADPLGTVGPLAMIEEYVAVIRAVVVKGR